MGLKYAELCTQCGKRRTRHPSGLCCRCQAHPLASKCKCCGRLTTRGRDCGTWSRKQRQGDEDLNSAIIVQRKRSTILELRQNGMSFGKIAEAVGLSKSQVYEAYRDMLRLPSSMTPEIVEAMDEDKAKKK